MLENPETFLDVRYAKLALVCTRPSCSVPVLARNGQPPKMCDFILVLPERITPEEVVLLRAKHLMTHIEEVTSVQVAE